MILKIHEVLEMKELFKDEINENFNIYYEESLDKDIAIQDYKIIEKNDVVSKTVNVYKGNTHSTLQKVKTYSFENQNMTHIRETISLDFPGIFCDWGHSTITSQAI